MEMGGNGGAPGGGRGWGKAAANGPEPPPESLDGAKMGKKWAKMGKTGQKKPFLVFFCPPRAPRTCLLQQSKEEKCHVHAPHSHFSHFTPRFMFWIKINCVSVIYRYISIYIYMYFFNTMALSSTQLNRVQKRKNKEREKLNK